MEIHHIQALECPVCFESVAVDPMIHTGCGNTFDRACVIELVQSHGRCPMCQAVVTMDQFKPNVVLRDALRELQDVAVHGGSNRREPVKVVDFPRPAFGPSIQKKDRLYGKEMKGIKELDRNLVTTHLEKKSTLKLRVDRNNRLVAVFKSGNWHFYRIGNGKGPEVYKCQHFDEGVRAIFPVKC